MTQSKRAIPERITAVLRAEELPDSIRARLTHGYVPGMPFRVTVEEADEQTKRDALLHDLAEGIADLEAGRVTDGDTLFAELRAKYPNAG